MFCCLVNAANDGAFCYCQIWLKMYINPLNRGNRMITSECRFVWVLCNSNAFLLISTMYVLKRFFTRETNSAAFCTFVLSNPPSL